jgi:hypothetical protein
MTSFCVLKGKNTLAPRGHAKTGQKNRVSLEAMSGHNCKLSRQKCFNNTFSSIFIQNKTLPLSVMPITMH